MQQTKIGETILFVGQNSGFLAKMQAEFPKTVVAASAATLSELAVSGTELSRRHAIVLFETDAGAADVEALKTLGAGHEGQPIFLALIDEDVPIGRARMLFEAGAEVLPNGNAADALSRSLTRFMSGGAGTEIAQPAQPALPARARGAVYSVVSTRGGAGATTVAVNLAVSLAASLPSDRKDKTLPNPVLLLDLDIQFGNAGTYVDVEDNGGLTELLAGETQPTPDRVLRMTQDTGLGVDVLTAPGIFVPLTAMTAELAQRIVDIVSERYAHVVIDLPRAALDWVEPVVRASDRLLLVSDGSVPCIRQAKRMMDLYRELEPTLAIDVVMNRERKPLIGPSSMQRDAEELLKIKLATWVSKDEAGERRAIDLGRPSATGRSRNRKAFRQLARRLMAARGETDITTGK